MLLGVKSITNAQGYQQITSLSSAQSLSVPTTTAQGNKQQPIFAIIIAETQDVRWRDDGTAPTASVGMPLTKNTAFIYDGDLTKIQFIEQTASAKLNVTYYS